MDSTRSLLYVSTELEMKFIKVLIKKFIEYLKQEPEKIKIEKPLCHHCATRGVVLQNEIKKNAK